MRPSFRKEVVSGTVIFALPIALLSIFPFDKIKISSMETARQGLCKASLVVLTEEEARTAVQSARLAWQVNKGQQHRSRAELFVPELPEAVNPSVIDLASRPDAYKMNPVGYDFPPMLPTQAAETQQKMPQAASSDPSWELTFSREELLRLD